MTRGEIEILLCEDGFKVYGWSPHKGRCWMAGRFKTRREAIRYARNLPVEYCRDSHDSEIVPFPGGCA